MSGIFKVYIADGQEYFVNQKGEKPAKTGFPFAQSLLDFLYLDMDAFDGAFEEIASAAQKLYSAKDVSQGEKIQTALAELAQAHIYFEYLALDWNERFERIKRRDNLEIMELLSYKKKLAQLPECIRGMQAQVLLLLEQVLDITSPDKPISEKMVKYESPKEDGGQAPFRFGAQTLTYEVIDKKNFCEVLYPAGVGDLVAFFVRECVKREQRFRVCKNCDRYFALSGYVNAEYCERPFDDLGHTCKEMGAQNVWQKKAKKPAYELYSKEYKKRFARIKYGKVTKEDFYTWAEKAREMRDKCMADEMEYEAFQQWIAEN